MRSGVRGGGSDGGGQGGGIFLSTSLTGGLDATIAGCTFAGNAAEGTGGALYIENTAFMVLRNTTLFNNTAERGGALEIDQGAAVRISYVTSAWNEATIAGDEIDTGVNAEVVLTHTILAGSSSSCSGVQPCSVL